MIGTFVRRYPGDESRRRFLVRGAAFAGAGVAGAMPSAVRAVAPPAPAGESRPAPAGYRETPHIRAYYDSARD